VLGSLLAELTCVYRVPPCCLQVIDGVLIPESFAAAYGLQDIPGATNATDANTTAEEPAGGADNATAAAKGDATKKGDAAAPSPSPKPKSAADVAAAALLSVPALLAALML
jgi:hypothetical protein